MAAKKTRRVALLTVPREDILQGISRYVGPDSPWSFQLCYPTAKAIRQLAAEPPDGVIAYIWEQKMAESVRDIPCPVVNHSGALEHVETPRVTCDSVAAGTMAAEHFLDRGFSNFAFLGDEGTAFSSERERGFVSRVARDGHLCRTHHAHAEPYPGSHERSAKADRQVASWLEALTRPVALFAANDWLAWWVTELAAPAGIRIPEDMAVMGVDDNPLCKLSRPPLSSVRYPSGRVGYESARMLDLLMSGKRTRSDVRIAPEVIVTRQSTDILAIDDPGIAMAVRFIRDYYTRAIGVDDVARAANMNRRTMEKRFKATLGRTPAVEIRRVRVESAKDLLRRPELSMETVAERSGFSSRRWMSTVFSQVTGSTPGKYRKECASVAHGKDNGQQLPGGSP